MTEELQNEEAATETGEFWQDPGPGFSAESSPEAPTAEQVGEDGQEIGWTGESVSLFLSELQAPAFNAMLNPVLGVGVDSVDWSHRKSRLDVIAPAIAREWNKIPEVRALAGQTDRGIILSYLLLEYFGPRTFEVVQERKVRAAAAEAAAEQAAAAEPATGAAPMVDGEPRDMGERVQGLPKRGL